jgi:hypothetical protein
MRAPSEKWTPVISSSIRGLTATLATVVTLPAASNIGYLETSCRRAYPGFARNIAVKARAVAGTLRVAPGANRRRIPRITALDRLGAGRRLEASRRCASLIAAQRRWSWPLARPRPGSRGRLPWFLLDAGSGARLAAAHQVVKCKKSDR